MSEAQTPMPQYRSHKKVWALKIKNVQFSSTQANTVYLVFEDSTYAAIAVSTKDRPQPQDGWYYVTYEDGYHSFSPAEQFEAGYSPITPNDNPHGEWHGIGWAVKHVQNGMRVRRAGWNGKGMWVAFNRGNHVTITENRPLAAVFSVGAEVDIRAYLILYTAQGDIVPWAPSVSDTLATDWEFAE